MVFYAMTILQRTVLVCYRYKTFLHLILIISILYRTHLNGIYVLASKNKIGVHCGCQVGYPPYYHNAFLEKKYFHNFKQPQNTFRLKIQIHFFLKINTLPS